MRQPAVIGVVLAILALAVDTVPTAAQSPYSYPWCSRGTRSFSLSCYFRSYQECRTNGPFCLRNPNYRGPPSPRAH
jgi:hypothetical protein